MTGQTPPKNKPDKALKMHSTVSELIKPCLMSIDSFRFFFFFQETKQKYDSKEQVVNSLTSAGCRICRNKQTNKKKDAEKNLPSVSYKKKAYNL